MSHFKEPLNGAFKGAVQEGHSSRAALHGKMLGPIGHGIGGRWDAGRTFDVKITWSRLPSKVSLK